MEKFVEALRRIAQNDYMIDSSMLDDGETLLAAADYMERLIVTSDACREGRIFRTVGENFGVQYWIRFPAGKRNHPFESFTEAVDALMEEVK